MATRQVARRRAAETVGSAPVSHLLSGRGGLLPAELGGKENFEAAGETEIRCVCGGGRNRRAAMPVLPRRDAGDEEEDTEGEREGQRHSRERPNPTRCHQDAELQQAHERAYINLAVD